MTGDSRPLTGLLVDRTRLPVIDCGSCGHHSLTWLDVGDEDDAPDQLRCLSCNAAVDESRIGATGTRGLEQMGYVLLDRRRHAPAKLSGCGANGARSCGSGGCSSGNCGTGGGGCASGGCGR